VRLIEHQPMALLIKSDEAFQSPMQRFPW